jgi:transposase
MSNELQLSLERLPGYAPDLNPIENVWGHLKSQELANLCSNTIRDVASWRFHRYPRGNKLPWHD